MRPMIVMLIKGWPVLRRSLIGRGRDSTVFQCFDSVKRFGLRFLERAVNQLKEVSCFAASERF